MPLQFLASLLEKLLMCAERKQIHIEMHCSKVDLLPGFYEGPFRNQYYDWRCA
jgi:hypothetical protein